MGSEGDVEGEGGKGLGGGGEAEVVAGIKSNSGGQIAAAAVEDSRRGWKKGEAIRKHCSRHPPDKLKVLDFKDINYAILYE